MYGKGIRVGFGENEQMSEDKLFYLYSDRFDDRLPLQGNDVSDAYHKMSELYEHRHALFAALIKAYDSIITPIGPTSVSAWKAKVHYDGTMFDGHFIAGLTKKNLDSSVTHITYHLPLSWWDNIRCIEIMAAPKWDGHTSQDVIQRLIAL